MTKERKSNCEIVTSVFIQFLSFFTWNVLHKFSSSEICFMKGWKFYTDFLLLLLLFHFENKFFKKRREWSCSKCNFNFFFLLPKSGVGAKVSSFFAKKSQNSINLWLQNVSQKFDQIWGDNFQNFLGRKKFFFSDHRFRLKASISVPLTELGVTVIKPFFSLSLRRNKLDRSFRRNLIFVSKSRWSTHSSKGMLQTRKY
jgi:hypothetical protein